MANGQFSLLQKPTLPLQRRFVSNLRPRSARANLAAAATERTVMYCTDGSSHGEAAAPQLPDDGT